MKAAYRYSYIDIGYAMNRMAGANWMAAIGTWREVGKKNGPFPPMYIGFKVRNP